MASTAKAAGMQESAARGYPIPFAALADSVAILPTSLEVPAREKPSGDDVDSARVKARAKRAEAPPDGNDALDGSMRLPRAERLILTVLAQYPGRRTKAQVAILAGYAVGGGGFNNAISALRTRGWLTGNASGMTITAQGLAALGPFTPLPHGKALLEYWLGRLPRAERKALEALVEVYPRTLSKAQLASRAGYEPAGGGFNNALSKLRTLELIRGRGEMRASEALFETAARAR